MRCSRRTRSSGRRWPGGSEPWSMALPPPPSHSHLLPPLIPRMRYPLTPSPSRRLARERDTLQRERKGLCQELREATECREVGAARPCPRHHALPAAARPRGSAGGRPGAGLAPAR